MQKTTSFYNPANRKKRKIEELIKQVAELTARIEGTEKLLESLKRDKIKLQREVHSLQHRSGMELLDTVKLAFSRKDSPRTTEEEDSSEEEGTAIASTDSYIPSAFLGKRRSNPELPVTKPQPLRASGKHSLVTFE